MLADFVLLEENPFKVSTDRIKDIMVYATYLDGNKVYQK